MPDPRDQARYILLFNIIIKHCFCIIFLGQGDSLNISGFLGFEYEKDYNIQQFLLFEMLDLCVKSMIENGDCFYCSNSNTDNKKVCTNPDLCKSFLFQGLEQEAKKCCKEKGFNG